MEIIIEHIRKRIELKDMSTEHVFNSLVMMFNTVAPNHLKIEGAANYITRGIDIGNKEQVLKAVAALIKELKSRKDITSDMWNKLETMRKNSKEIKLLKE